MLQCNWWICPKISDRLFAAMHKTSDMKKLVPFIACIFFFYMASSQTNDAWQQKVDASLLEKTANGTTVDFLIILEKQADITDAKQLKTKDEKAQYVLEQLRQTANASQAGLLHFLEQKNAPHKPLFIVNLIKSNGDLALIQQLAERSEVAQILDNPSIQFDGPVERETSSLRTTDWGIQKVKADSVWAMGFRGQGVTVGGQDTGYEWQHPALKAQYRGYYAPTDTFDHNHNWHDAIHQISPLNNDSIPDPINNPCGIDSPEPCDDHNHGTHTMGTMAGLDGDNEIGLAPEASWCGCRNMERGWGTPFTYLECFQWFVAPTDLNDENPDPTKSPHVIANSWTCPEVEGCNPSNFAVMNLAVQNLKLAGTMVVVSAGNSGGNCSTVNAPAAIFESSFSVGATNINDTIAGFSSRGPVMVDGSGRLKPNISAPGVNIRSSIRNGEYATYSGTSMAGPYVAGVVALMISANPDLAGQVELIETIIEQTAVPLVTDQECDSIPGTQVPNYTYGYGRIDALEAVEEALSLIEPNAVTEQEVGEVRVFPNPFFGRLNLEVKNWNGELAFDIFDLNGRPMLHRDFSMKNGPFHQIDLPELIPGIYFYRLFYGGKMGQGKLIRQ